MRFRAMTLIAAVLISAVFTFAGTNPQKEMQKRLKAAGQLPPELTIAAPPDKIKALVMSEMIHDGYRPESDSSYSFDFTRQAEGMEAFSAAMFMGNARSDMPLRHARFTFVPDGDKTTVTYDADITVQMANGKVNHTVGGVMFRGELRDLLDWVKDKTEAVSVPSSTPTSRSAASTGQWISSF